MINTIGDKYFIDNPNKVLGEMSIGFRNKIEVKGDKQVVISYFEKKDINNYITRIKLIEARLKKDSDNKTLIARLKLLKKKNESS